MASRYFGLLDNSGQYSLQLAIILAQAVAAVGSRLSNLERVLARL